MQTNRLTSCSHNQFQKYNVPNYSYYFLYVFARADVNTNTNINKIHIELFFTGLRFTLKSSSTCLYRQTWFFLIRHRHHVSLGWLGSLYNTFCLFIIIYLVDGIYCSSQVSMRSLLFAYCLYVGIQVWIDFS